MGSLNYANGKLWTAVGILATHPGRIQEATDQGLPRRSCLCAGARPTKLLQANL